jgi:hypothetical protein
MAGCCRFSKKAKKGQRCKRVKGGALLCCPKKRTAKKHATKKRAKHSRHKSHHASRAYYDSSFTPGLKGR